MNTGLQETLRFRAVNGWPLFWLVSLPMSIIMLVEMSGVDMSMGGGVSSMIGFSVRFAVPLIFLVVAASSMQLLFPGPLTNWWLRNRKYIGMCFAVAMGWQGLFIAMMSLFFRDYYYEDIYLLRDELEGSVGYIFLSAMVVTTFRFGRRQLSATQWRLLHKSGIYFLWAYPFSVYWWNFSRYYGSPDTIDYIFYWMGFLAFASRIAAWGKKRSRSSHKAGQDAGAPPVFRFFGAALIFLGIALSATGRYWREPVSNFLLAPEWSATLELWLPYWPLQPFIPLFVIGFGTLLATKAKT